MKPLREARAERLMTIRELAEKAGVSASTVYMVENGKTIPRLAAIKKLAAALEVDPLTIEEFRRGIDVTARGRDDQSGKTQAAA